MLTLTSPDWLTRRGGSLRPDPDGNRCFVMFDGQPRYTLTPRPVTGLFGCLIRQTNSGQPIDSASTAADHSGALANGLEDLRKSLGW